MKKILALDLGTNSVGWAYVNEAENKDEKSSIVKLGVRTIHYDNFVSTDTGKEIKGDPADSFKGGKGVSPNAARTCKRSMRRNIQRYKLRREYLIRILKRYGFITDESILSEDGNNTTFQTYRLRAKAATEEISLEEFSRVLLMINKKRGYKSSRKIKFKDEGELIDGMEIAKQLYEKDLTPGQFTLSLLQQGKKYIPDYYRSDLDAEFEKVFNKQMEYYPDLLNPALKEELRGKKRDAVWTICEKWFKEKGFELVGIKRQGKISEQKKENYLWRVKALSEKMSLEQFVIIIQQINIQVNASSGYLGAVSDRSKELYFNKQTVGQYQMCALDHNPNYSLKNQVFYRQDYMDEFDTIWTTQARFHKELSSELKKEIRDVVIFYQRPLKSQKGLVNFCEFENKQIEVIVDGKKKIKTIGQRACPKSSPLFQEFKIWQILNNIQVYGKTILDQQTDIYGNAGDCVVGKRFLDKEEKDVLFEELNIKDKLSKSDVLEILFKNYKELDLNYKSIEGNSTQSALFKAYQMIIESSGHGEYDFSQMKYSEIIRIVEPVFKGLNYNTEILHFDSSIEGKDFEKQPAYKLWHLLYSFGDDNSKSGYEKLINKISETYGFNHEHAKIIAAVSFVQDYGSLSAKAMRKILPYMKDGNIYDLACEYAGYRHSKRSLTKEELDNKIYKNKLDLLPRNSLRNPIVEKILNQMVNVVNCVVDKYGKPDEIRIELARDLKKSAEERKELTKILAETNIKNEEYRKKIKEEFGYNNISRNDLIRYKLWLELSSTGHKSMYSNQKISNPFDENVTIEHIIPKAKLFDDSFSNKTLEFRSVNVDKGDMTAYDYVYKKYGEEGVNEYKLKVDKLLKDKQISLTKHKLLLIKEKDIPSGFIERDLRDSQYIAKKAREILEEMVKFVVPTTGSITDRLREDWQLVDVMQELNWDKYNELGMTEIIEDNSGRKIRRIKDWTKRNDHRHHAMDALIIAFTKRSIIQYLNNMNARSDKSGSVYGIEKNELHRDSHGHLRFNSPIPLNEFRTEAKHQLENIIISTKAKNKLVTNNINAIKVKCGVKKKDQLTPRGQLHNETVYGSIKRYVTKEEKVGANFDANKIESVASPKIKELLFKRLEQFGNDAKKAFTGKNSLDKNPIFIDKSNSKTVPLKVKILYFETIFTIKKEITPDLKIEKVIDTKIRSILEARLIEYGNDKKKAFVNLDENPIWLNKEKGIAIKKVTITGVTNVVALHNMHNHKGNLILDSSGNPQPSDYVSTGNNHHVAIYRDKEGNLQEEVVPFFTAVKRINAGLPAIDKDHNKAKGWEFLFTMKQNEYFVLPNKKTGFYPKDIDLTNPDNYSLISPNLFRVQKIASRNYMFRHHLETVIGEDKQLRRISWELIQSPSNLEGIVKVRVNHIGQIVSVGEY